MKTPSLILNQKNGLKKGIVTVSSKGVSLVLIMALAQISSPAMACSCPWLGRLEERAVDSPLVIRAKIVRTSGFWPRKVHSVRGEKYESYKSITVKTLEVLKGRAAPDTFTLLGDNGMLCLTTLLNTRFTKGGEYLFVLETDQQRQPISLCGEYWAPVQESVYRGQDSEGKGYEATLDDLRSKLGK
ncbi:MAG: hypothetical protein AAF662_13780 [Pseudomonadota bacterium]